MKCLTGPTKFYMYVLGKLLNSKPEKRTMSLTISDGNISRHDNLTVQEVFWQSEVSCAVPIPLILSRRKEQTLITKSDNHES